MRYWLYRWFMTLAHRYGWHKMDEFHPEGDTLLWCQWCGLGVVTKRHLTKDAADYRKARGALRIEGLDAVKEIRKLRGG